MYRRCDYKASSSATTLAETVADLVGLLLGFRFSHDAHERFGAGGTQEHAAGVAEHFLFAFDGRLHFGVGFGCELVDVWHIDEGLRQLREVGCEFFETLAGVDHFVAQGQCGECTVAGGGEFAVDHVAGLFAAERIVAAQHSSST